MEVENVSNKYTFYNQKEGASRAITKKNVLSRLRNNVVLKNRDECKKYFFLLYYNPIGEKNRKNYVITVTK
jgi:hypothetical protein